MITLRKSVLLSFALAAVAACERSTTKADGALPEAEASKELASGAPRAASGAPKQPPPPPKPKGPEEPLNVLLILIDSLRADMPWAGYPRAIAPYLTKLESESVSYTRAYSVSSYTAKSVAALLSGKYPSTLYRSAPFFTHYPQANLFLAEVLGEHAVHSLSAQAHLYMRRGSGLDQGFVQWETVEGIRFDAQTDNHVTSHKLTPLVIEQLKKVPSGQRFFAYVHYMDPHDQYTRHKDGPDFGNKPRDRYDSEVHYTDGWVEKLLEYCRAQDFWKRTAVIVSADHGEAFGEHGATRHAFHLWDVLTHVPLFFRLPGVDGRRIAVPRSAIDLAPTILELTGVEAKTDFVGTSLVAELYGAAKPEPRPVLLDLPEDTNNPELRAYIEGNEKLLVYGRDARFELYDLALDPEEKQNLAKKEPERLERLKASYQKAWKSHARIRPYGGNKLVSGALANGPLGPPK